MEGANLYLFLHQQGILPKGDHLEGDRLEGDRLGDHQSQDIIAYLMVRLRHHHTVRLHI